MSEVQLAELTADELLSIIAVLTNARVRIRAHQLNDIADLRPMPWDAMRGAPR